MPQLDNKTVDKLLNAGMMKPKFAHYMQVYAMFVKDYEKTGSKMQSYINVAMNLGTTERTVMRAIREVKEI